MNGPFYPNGLGHFTHSMGQNGPEGSFFYIGYKHLMVYVGSLLSGPLHLVMNKDHKTH